MPRPPHRPPRSKPPPVRPVSPACAESPGIFRSGGRTARARSHTAAHIRVFVPARRPSARCGRARPRLRGAPLHPPMAPAQSAALHRTRAARAAHRPDSSARRARRPKSQPGPPCCCRRVRPPPPRARTDCPRARDAPRPTPSSPKRCGRNQAGHRAGPAPRSGDLPQPPARQQAAAVRQAWFPPEAPVPRDRRCVAAPASHPRNRARSRPPLRARRHGSGQRPPAPAIVRPAIRRLRRIPAPPSGNAHRKSGRRLSADHRVFRSSQSQPPCNHAAQNFARAAA